MTQSTVVLMILVTIQRINFKVSQCTFEIQLKATFYLVLSTLFQHIMASSTVNALKNVEINVSTSLGLCFFFLIC